VSQKIDDPVETSFEAWGPDSPNLGDRLVNLALTFAGFTFVPAKLFQILKDQFANSSRFDRIDYLFRGIHLGFQRIQAEVTESREKLKVVSAKLEDDRFREAVAVACEETARAVSRKKIDQMSKVLIAYADPTASAWASADADIATMIRDLAQLGDRDIRVLLILATVHAPVLSKLPNLNRSDLFSAETKNLMSAVSKSGIDSDDFLSTCERLRGFGLAVEVLRNTSHMSPEDFCYRPTRRGLLLLDYLKPTNADAGATA
jgi:hypothetical protein